MGNKILKIIKLIENTREFITLFAVKRTIIGPNKLTL